MVEAALSMSAGLDRTNGPGANNQFADLVERIAIHEDKRAFTELFAHFGPRLKGFMIKRGLEPDAAEDLSQETMIRVWHKAGMYSGQKGSVATWIFTIARNLHIDAARRQKVVQFTDLADFDRECEDPVSDEQVIVQQETVLVAEAIGLLPADQRRIIEMAFMQEMSQTEIAETLGLPLGTVKSRMRLAYQKLSKSLEGL